VLAGFSGIADFSEIVTGSEQLSAFSHQLSAGSFQLVPQQAPILCNDPTL